MVDIKHHYLLFSLFFLVLFIFLVLALVCVVAASCETSDLGAHTLAKPIIAPKARTILVTPIIMFFS